MTKKAKIINGKLEVPDFPIIPFIEGDGIGKDITGPSQKVIDAAVEKAYGNSRKIEWKEVLAGEKAYHQTGSYLPDETLEAFKEFFVFLGPCLVFNSRINILSIFSKNMHVYH